MNGYNFIRADQPSNVKKGGAGINYKDSIAVQIINTNFLSECLLCEVTVNNKKGYIAVLYRSPSQTNTVFNDFISSFEKLLQELSALNPDFSIVLGDFNARSKSWWKSDIDTIEGTKIHSVTISYGLQQLITQPKHLLANSSSCIDLLFTDQPSLIVDCGIHPSFHSNCHHQILSILHLIREVSGILKGPILIQKEKQLEWKTGIPCSWIKMFINNFPLLKPHWWIYSQTAFPVNISLLMKKTPHGWRELLRIKLIWLESDNSNNQLIWIRVDFYQKGKSL